MFDVKSLFGSSTVAGSSDFRSGRNGAGRLCGQGSVSS